MLLFPGAYSTIDEFEAEGFIDALRAARIDADVASIGTRIEHYVEGTALARLQADVLAPVAARGRRRLCFVGISLGALIAAAAAAQAADAGHDVAGVVLIAPYLGSAELLAAIDAAGGPAGWAAAHPAPRGERLEQRFWRRVARGPWPELHLAYGAQDRFAPAHRQLAAWLDPARVLVRPGGHDWPAWRVLWRDALERGWLGAAAHAPLGAGGRR